MFELRRALRGSLSWSHRWLGFVAGAFFCLLAFTGGVVTFRPQVAMLLAPQPEHAAPCLDTLDWNRVERDVETYGQARINRIYAPVAPETRYRFRMATSQDAIYSHVIYDGCTGQILGTANLSWLDWLVDFHHNLRSGRTGRWWGGILGVLLLASGIGGILLWLASNPSLRRLLRIRRGALLHRDLHTTAGVIAGVLLLLGSFTGLWLCFPQTMRTALSALVTVPEDAPVPRARKPKGATQYAGLGDIVQAAQREIPDGVVREIRLPEGYGNVQIRMWREGDFRSLGNNVVVIDRGTNKVLSVSLYANQSSSQRFVQAMQGLHYGEWGGLFFRSIYGIAGLLSSLLLVTGFFLWWLPRLKRPKRRAEAVAPKPITPVSHAVNS